MARRRGRKGRGRRGSKSIPALQTVVLGYPVLAAFKQHGMTVAALDQAAFNVTGFTPSTGKWNDPNRGIYNAIVLIALSTIGAKIANRSGANRLIKKATGNIIRLA